MLAHSPSLPLIVDYFAQTHDLSTEDDEQLILALKQRDRVSRIRLNAEQQKLIVAMDDEYPTLEYLIVVPTLGDNNTILKFLETLQAPHLRHLTLGGFALPIGSRLLTSAVGLVTLCLFMCHPSTYFHPNTLVQWISIMPQLETLAIHFSLPVGRHDVERQIMHTPITTLVTLPNLHYLSFDGVSTYLEALLPRITAPRLEKLEIDFFLQFAFSVPRLQQLMNTTENIRFDSARFRFSDKRVSVALHLREVEMVPLVIAVDCWHLSSQVSSMAQISNSLGQVFSAVEHLALVYDAHSRFYKVHHAVNRTVWRELLRPFNGVNTFQIAEGLVGGLSRSLQLENGELPLELLPELQELTFPQEGNNGDAFTSFVSSRENAGRAVTLVRR